MRFVLACVALTCGCGSKDPPPGTGTGSASGAGSAPSPAGWLKPLARVPPTSKLLVGSRRVAIVADQGYYEPGAPPTIRGTISTELVKLRKQWPDATIRFGAYPIIAGGDDHHPTYVRLTPAPKAVELDGYVNRAVGLSNGLDVWQFEDKLVHHLAVVDPAGKVTVLPDHPLVGDKITHTSPVTARRCATPEIVDLVANGDTAMALIVECDQDAPVRVASYRWASADEKPEISVADVGTTRKLGYGPHLLLVSGDKRKLLGSMGQGLVTDRDPGNTRMLQGVTRTAAAAFADDGAIWSLTISTDLWQVARDGVVQSLVEPSGATGATLKPSQLGFDTRHGVIVLASNEGSVWLFSER